MSLWAALMALGAAVLAALALAPDMSVIVSGALELGAVLALFTLVCAAEANS